MATTLARKTLSSLILNNPSTASVLLFRYRFSTSTEYDKTVSIDAVSEFLINRYHFSHETAKRVSAIFPKNPQETEAVLSYLRELGLTNTQLERIVKSMPRIVYKTPANIESKVKILLDFGFSDSETVEIIVTDPYILRYSLDRISSSLSVLKSVLGSNERLSYLLRKQKRLIRSDYEKTLLPNIRILNNCGIGTEQINGLMYTFPLFFTRSKPESMKELVDKATKMGVDKDSKMFIYAVRALASMNDETCMLKLKFFQDLGFKEDDIARMLRTSPGVLSISQTKIEKVKELLLETGKYDMSCIIKLPCSLLSSVEKRYKPRLQILKHLEKRGLIDKWPSLGSLCLMTDDRFSKRFAALNADEGSMTLLGKSNISDNIETENHSNKCD